MGRSVGRLGRAVTFAAALAAVGACVLAAPAAAAPATHPGAVVTDSCDEGGAAIDLFNPGGHDALFQIFTDGVQFGGDIAVPAGQAAHVVVPLGEGETIAVQVLVNGTEVVSTAVGHHCLQASASIDYACGNDGATVALGNGGAGGVTFVVTSNGVQFGDPIVLGPGGLVMLSVPVAEDASAEIAVAVDGIEIARQVVHRDCEQPAVVAITLNCAQGGAVVDLRNDGSVLSWAELRVDGVPTGDAVAIPPGGVATGFVPLPEDTTRTVSVASNGVSIGAATFAVDCVAAPPITTPPVTPPPADNPSGTPTASNSAGTTGRPECQDVLGVKITRNGTIPTTGTTTRPLLLAAGLLLLLGGSLVALSARPAPALLHLRSRL